MMDNVQNCELQEHAVWLKTNDNNVKCKISCPVSNLVL
jgi:hypothetical protein